MGNVAWFFVGVFSGAVFFFGWEFFYIMRLKRKLYQELRDDFMAFSDMLIDLCSQAVGKSDGKKAAALINGLETDVFAKCGQATASYQQLLKRKDELNPDIVDSFVCFYDYYARCFGSLKRLLDWKTWRNIPETGILTSMHYGHLRSIAEELEKSIEQIFL